MLFKRRKRRQNDGHYASYKEFARGVIVERTRYWNQHYDFQYGRVAIKNQRRCWGSCSAKQNLNFNYRLIFIPELLMDYVIVHELCHLAELNHSKTFWEQVGKALPDYEERRRHLRRITSVPGSGFPSSVFARRYTHVN